MSPRNDPGHRRVLGTMDCPPAAIQAAPDETLEIMSCVEGSFGVATMGFVTTADLRYQQHVWVVDDSGTVVAHRMEDDLPAWYHDMEMAGGAALHAIDLDRDGVDELLCEHTYDHHGDMASNLVVLAIHGDAIDAIGTIALSRDNGVVTCTSTWKLVGRTVRVKTAGRSTCPKRGTHRYRVRRGGVVSVAR